MSAFKSTSSLTITVLGCGNMGVSILGGLLSSQVKTTPGLSAISNDENNTRPPSFSRFIACVNRPESIPTVQNALSANVIGTKNEIPSIDVWQGRNVKAVQEADVILLSCHSSQVASILSYPAMADALSDKILISICPGLTVPNIEALIQDVGSNSSKQVRCTVIHAMPNTASAIRESCTIISNFQEQVSPFVSQVVQHVFSSIGTTITVSGSLMSAASITAASTPAFFALALEGVVQGAVAEGIDRQDAIAMAAQAMKGVAEMVLKGEDPKEVMEKVLTPNGCTEKGVGILRASKVEETFAEALIMAIRRVFELSNQK